MCLGAVPAAGVRVDGLDDVALGPKPVAGRSRALVGPRREKLQRAVGVARAAPAYQSLRWEGRKGRKEREGGKRELVNGIFDDKNKRHNKCVSCITQHIESSALDHFAWSTMSSKKDNTLHRLCLRPAHAGREA